MLNMFELRKGNAALPSPRIFVYPLPAHIAPPPTSWRNVRALVTWLQRSRFHEMNPFCADYYLIPSHPENRDKATGKLVGDLLMVKLMDFIRMQWPFWNRTVRQGHARHFIVLPCDHGPGDCAYTRPLTPNKYSPTRLARARYRSSNEGDFISSTWGDAWETINPASPNRLLFFLQCAPTCTRT